jgi:iron complex outermembrane recepter protein
MINTRRMKTMPETVPSLWRAFLFLGLALGTPSAGLAQNSRDLTQASLEDLMNIRVTSVSKKEQQLRRAGAAIFVITQDDIRHSGAASIPELLRMVPGVDVAQIDAANWAVSVRGFNDRFANKVLVVIDGRSVYSPSTSGVFWDQQDVPLENIERIEVIRGPGGTVWGANAMNGVINIITKNSKATQGGVVRVQAGSQDSAAELVQYGGKVGGIGSYRVYENYFNRGSSTFRDGSPAGDSWHMLHTAFRSDWDVSSRDTVTVQSGLYVTGGSSTITTLLSNALPLEVTIGARSDVRGGNILGRWNRTLTDGSDISLQAFYNRDDRDQFGIRNSVTTADFDFKDHLVVGATHDIVWGGGYRFSSDTSTPGYAITLLPLYPTDNLLNVFVQDEIRLSAAVSLTVGSKLEHNTYTGFEYEPSAQIVWAPTSRQTIWASAARAVRQPARVDATVQIDYGTQPLPGGGFALLQIQRPSSLDTERLRDFETGYRTQINSRLSLDASAFLGFYSSLRTQEIGTPIFVFVPPPPHLVIPLLPANLGHGKSYGGEVFMTWSATPRWRFTPSYSYLRVNLTRALESQDTTLQATASASPRNQFQIRSLLNLTRHLDWDASLAYTGTLRDGGSGSTPGYTRVDTRLEWRLGEHAALSLVAQNLLTPRHIEFQDVYPTRAAFIERKALAGITWRF